MGDASLWGGDLESLQPLVGPALWRKRVQAEQVLETWGSPPSKHVQPQRPASTLGAQGSGRVGWSTGAGGAWVGTLTSWGGG